MSNFQEMYKILISLKNTTTTTQKENQMEIKYNKKNEMKVIRNNIKK